ncbi:hypothetical protein [Nocardioides sp. R-C-SC26]|uniref:hypothetical protein n=1 Tax=Nocardioides sp. R-C-SC26 TaxID=2870414 RepID=UPI001E5FAA47|nr:hypothetical protein [Nocardioides sp. R-C-SC26]
MSRRARRAPLAMATGAVLVLVVVGCGEETEVPRDGSRPDAGRVDGDATVTTRGPVTVIDGGDGAQLCLGGVATSLPPQCGGPRLIGWDWAEHAGDFEEAAATRWGVFVVTGRYDGAAATFTPSEVVSAADWTEPNPVDDDPVWSTPCAEPDGGWAPLDVATTTDATQDRAGAIARKLPGFAGLWVDQSINPAAAEIEAGGSGEDVEMAMNDPRLLVLNVAVTQDVDGAERALREVWGGALCVSQARHTESDLRRIQDAVMETDGFLSSSSGRDRVELGVVFDDGTLQAAMDERYGDGVVVVEPALQPVSG